MSSFSGTFSVSRSSGSGSGLPSRSRQISAVSSRSPSAPSTALSSGAERRTPCRRSIGVTRRGRRRGPCRAARRRPSRRRGAARGSAAWRCSPGVDLLVGGRPRSSCCCVARFLKPLSSSSRAIRSALAWKLSRSGRSTVILWKPKSSLSKTLLTTSAFSRRRSIGEDPRLAVLEVAVDAGDLADLVGLAVVAVADLVALVAQALAHLDEEAAGVDELDLAFALRLLAVGEHPDVGRDAGVVEKLVRQGDDRLEPVVFDDPAADLALAAAGVAGEQRRAVEDDRDRGCRPARGARILESMCCKKEQRAVVDARQPGAEAALDSRACRARSR